MRVWQRRRQVASCKGALGYAYVPCNAPLRPPPPKCTLATGTHRDAGCQCCALLRRPGATPHHTRSSSRHHKPCNLWPSQPVATQEVRGSRTLRLQFKQCRLFELLTLKTLVCFCTNSLPPHLAHPAGSWSEHEMPPAPPPAATIRKSLSYLLPPPAGRHPVTTVPRHCPPLASAAPGPCSTASRPSAVPA